MDAVICQPFQQPDAQAARPLVYQVFAHAILLGDFLGGQAAYHVIIYNHAVLPVLTNFGEQPAHYGSLLADLRLDIRRRALGRDRVYRRRSLTGIITGHCGRLPAFVAANTANRVDHLTGGDPGDEAGQLALPAPGGEPAIDLEHRARDHVVGRIPGWKSEPRAADHVIDKPLVACYDRLETLVRRGSVGLRGSEKQVH